MRRPPRKPIWAVGEIKLWQREGRDFCYLRERKQAKVYWLRWKMQNGLGFLLGLWALLFKCRSCLLRTRTVRHIWSILAPGD